MTGAFAMPFVKRLTRVGNSTGIILDRPLLDQIDVEPDGEVELRVQGKSLVITPHRYATPAEGKAAGEKVFNTRRKLLKRLAK